MESSCVDGGMASEFLLWTDGDSSMSCTEWPS